MPRRRSIVRALATLGLAGTMAALSGAPASGVAHGAPAAAGQDPFAVKLTMTHIPRPDGTYYDSACSAALISPTWIITAGHCFHDINRNPVSGPVPYATTATLNTVDVNADAGEVRSVVLVKQASNVDIALAQLSAPVSDVVPLALNRAKPAVGGVLTIAGWGATSSVNPVPATRLSVGQVKIRTVKSTTVAVAGYYPGPDTSACLYDSGAPYFTTPKNAPPLLVSVESDGPACPHTSVETTVRVDPVVAWIKTVVPDLPT